MTDVIEVIIEPAKVIEVEVIGGPPGPPGAGVAITVVTTQAAFNAANPGPLELVVLYAQA